VGVVGFSFGINGERRDLQVEARAHVRVQQEIDRLHAAGALLEQVVLRGELARGDAARVTGLQERAARDLLAALVKDGSLGSDTPKDPVSLRFPLDAVEGLFPGLFPET
jgi:hypothetical protein